MTEILPTIKERVLHFAKNQEVTIQDFFKKTGLKYSNFTGKSKNSDLQSKVIAEILPKYPNLNIEWLLTGNGSMLKKNGSFENTQKNLIPLYDDVATIGGNTEMIAKTTGVYHTIEYIDAGDWFKDVTAAIRHYGNSMQEYPNGCILALRKITDTRGIVWGRNYVIETNDIRVTKRMQTCPDDNECIMAYSTNTESYPDGRLVHEPFKIYKEDIKRIFLVIGRVVKEYSSDPVYTMQKQ